MPSASAAGERVEIDAVERGAAHNTFPAARTAWLRRGSARERYDQRCGEATATRQDDDLGLDNTQEPAELAP